MHLIGGLLTVLEVSWQAWYWGSIGNCILERERESELEIVGWVWDFENLKAHPSDILSPTRPHLLILLIVLESATPW